jgi:cytidylate kinase
MIVTIDGTVGNGKSTAAGLARRLGADHLDTGAMYRALTLKALRDGLDLEDPEALTRMAASTTVELDGDPGAQRVRLDGVDVTAAVRENHVSTHTHYVARTPGVRATLVTRQRAFAARTADVVAERRDQGTVVFPDADVKFFLDADAEVRARRRQLELQERGLVRSYRDVLAEITERDRRDVTRDVSPLVAAADAVHVDTTDLSIGQMVDALAAEVERRRKEKA